MPVVPRGKRVRILSVCLSGFPGSDTALANLSAATGRTRHLVLTTSDPGGLEIRFFRRYIRQAAPSLVIFGGWSDVYRPLVQSLTRAGCKVAVYWTSSPGQTGLAGELRSLATLLDDPHVDHLWLVHRGTALALRQLEPKCAWLPNVFPPPAHESVGRRHRQSRSTAHISLFCSPREAPRKNAWCQLLALAGFEHPYHLHLNVLASQKPFDRLLRLLRIPFTDHGWMVRETYERVIGEMDVGLQVSMAESFNFVAADHILRGVPVLASPMVPVIADLPHSVSQRLIVARPDDPLAVRAALGALLRDVNLVRLAGAARRALIASNRRALDAAGRALTVALRASRR